MTTNTLSTRALAAATLDRVLRTGAYSNVLVAKKEYIERDDHGLFQRLVYEALRYLPSIDEAIDQASTRRTDRIQPEVLAVLRVGTAELRHLKRPHHSAVTLAVEAVRELGRPNASGFVNGVLRSVARRVDDEVSADLHQGMPDWLYERLVSVFGTDADAFIAASNLPAETGIRSRDGLQRGTPTGIDGSAYISRDQSIDYLVAQERIDIIDPASVAVVNALGVESGDTVADLAAAPGGKVRMIADHAGADGLVVACDIHPRRLATAKKRSSGMDRIKWLVADASAPPLARSRFDKVLLDAPCTGIGTLRRRPEIRYRMEPETPQRFGILQRSLLMSALDLVRPGGRLVYSVCTVFREETSDVVSGLGGRQSPDTLSIPWGDGSLLGPHISGTDGMFISVFDR